MLILDYRNFILQGQVIKGLSLIVTVEDKNHLCIGEVRPTICVCFANRHHSRFIFSKIENLTAIRFAWHDQIFGLAPPLNRSDFYHCTFAIEKGQSKFACGLSCELAFESVNLYLVGHFRVNKACFICVDIKFRYTSTQELLSIQGLVFFLNN